jgi:hypothetical protein
LPRLLILAFFFLCSCLVPFSCIFPVLITLITKNAYHVASQ